MLKRQWTVAVAIAVMASQPACYTTRIVTNRQPEGPANTDRQWFMLGGLASLSSPAGRECQNGVSWTESKLSGTDFLINLGLGVVGGFAGSLACANSDDVTRAYCATGGAWLVPFLLSSRTVEYACAAGGPERPAWMPPAGNAPAAPAAPAPSAP